MTSNEQLFEQRIKIGRCKRPEFTYRVPQMEPVQLQVPFYADTEDNKAIRYAVACETGLSDDPFPPLPETKECTDVMVRERHVRTHDGAWETSYVSIWLIPNQYTQAKQAVQVASMEFGHHAFINERPFLRQEIKRLLEGIIV